MSVKVAVFRFLYSVIYAGPVNSRLSVRQEPCFLRLMMTLPYAFLLKLEYNSLGFYILRVPFTGMLFE